MCVQLGQSHSSTVPLSVHSFFFHCSIYHTHEVKQIFTESKENVSGVCFPKTNHHDLRVVGGCQGGTMCLYCDFPEENFTP